MWAATDRHAAMPSAEGVDHEQSIGIARARTRDDAHGFGGGERARERRGRTEYARLLARRDLAGRRRVLEDAAIAGARTGQHGHDLAAEAEHARVHERHARRDRGVVDRELG